MEGLPLFIDDHHRYYAPLTPPPPSAPSPRPHSRQRCRVGAPAPPPSLCLPTTQPPGAHRVFHQRQAGLVEAESAGSAQWRPGLGETRGVVGERRGPGGVEAWNRPLPPAGVRLSILVASDPWSTLALGLSPPAYPTAFLPRVLPPLLPREDQHTFPQLPPPELNRA